MVHLIEPCCAGKHLLAVRNAVARVGTTSFEGYGDLSLTELLPPMLTRYARTELLIAAPSLPDQAAEVIDRMMRRQVARMDGRGNMDVIRHLTVVARLEKEKSDYIYRWMEEQPFGGRLTLVDLGQEDTAILLPDFAVTGPVNMRYGHHFIATATTEPGKVRALWERFTALEEKPAEEPVTEEAGEPVKKDAERDPGAAPARPAGKRTSRKRRKA